MSTGLNLKLHPLLLVSIIFLILSSTFFSPSHADEDNEGDDDETIIAWKKERSQFNASDNNNSTFILAAERTRRIDPTDHLQYYEGGWNIINPHYYASLLYSGAPPIYVAAVWVLGVVVFFLIALLCCCCGNNNGRSSYSRTVHWGSLIFIVIFLLLAIIGGAMLYTGQGHFEKAIVGVIDNIGRRISDLLDLLNSVLNNLDGAMKLAVGAYSLPQDYAKNIDQFRDLVHSNSSDNPRIIIGKVITSADKFLSTLSYALKVVVAVMLILAVFGFIFSVCGWKGIVRLLFFIGWILVTGTLILSALSLVVQNGIGDACVAMEEWLEHPQDRTSLNEIIPCVDGPTAQQALYITRNTSYLMTQMVDNFVKNIANVDPPPGAPPVASYNQSGPPLPLICNPFNADMTERPCEPQEIPLDSASQVYQGFVCNPSPDGGCSSVGRLSPNLYQQMMMAVNVSNALAQNGPKLIELVDCTFVAETFDEINEKYCPPMNRFSGFIFHGLLLLSLALLFSLILWLLLVRERDRQISSDHFR